VERIFRIRGLREFFAAGLTGMPVAFSPFLENRTERLAANENGIA
jgi:hypothetical protein